MPKALAFTYDTTPRTQEHSLYHSIQTLKKRFGDHCSVCSTKCLFTCRSACPIIFLDPLADPCTVQTQCCRSLFCTCALLASTVKFTKIREQRLMHTLRRTLDGFKSPWQMRMEWMYAIPSATSCRTNINRFQCERELDGEKKPALMAVARLPPLQYSCKGCTKIRTKACN